MTTNGNQPEKIDILVDQVGRLTESIHEVSHSIHELKIVVQTVAEQQNETVKSLVAIVNRQTETVDALIRHQQNS
jgi:uncharacterized protein YoxC